MPAGMPGMPPPLPIWRIILRVSMKRLTRPLTSWTVVPDPLAMRARREPLRISGLARSAGVIE